MRHAVNQPAETLHVALAGRTQDSASPEKQKALEDGMVEYVKQAGGERERGCAIHPVRLEGKRKSEPDENDADVFDRVIGEQPLEVVLHKRVKHTHDRGNASE